MSSSRLREVQRAAYQPKRKPSPAPALLAVLLPLLLIPAISPLIELISEPGEAPPQAINLQITSEPRPDEIDVHVDAQARLTLGPAPGGAEIGEDRLAGFQGRSVVLRVAPDATNGALGAALTRLKGADIASVRMVPSPSPISPNP